jgi:hypothetical protein
METVRPQALQLSPSMFIIKPQASTIHFTLPIMTRATNTIRIIIHLQLHGQTLITIQDIQAIPILGIGRAPIIQVIGQVHSQITKVHTILHGQASLKIGKVLIIQEIGQAHSTTIKAPTIQDGQVNLIIGRAHSTTTNHHGQVALTIISQAKIGVVAIIIPRAITIAMAKPISITTTTITPLRSTFITQSMTATLAA